MKTNLNIKKAVGAGLLVFTIQFTVVNIFSNMAGPFIKPGSWMIYAWQVVMYLVLVAIVYTTSRWYFKGNSSALTDGALLGVVFVLTGFIINLLQVIPAVALGRDIVNPILAYLKSTPFLIATGITIATTILTTYIINKKASTKSTPKSDGNKEACGDCKDGTCSIH